MSDQRWTIGRLAHLIRFLSSFLPTESLCCRFIFSFFFYFLIRCHLPVGPLGSVTIVCCNPLSQRIWWWYQWQCRATAAAPQHANVHFSLTRGGTNESGELLPTAPADAIRSSTSPVSARHTVAYIHSTTTKKPLKTGDHRKYTISFALASSLCCWAPLSLLFFSELHTIWPSNIIVASSPYNISPPPSLMKNHTFASST